MGSSNEAIVYQSANPIELSLAKNLLDQAGIPYVVHGGMATSLFRANYGAAFAGNQSIAVREEDRERVLDLFEEAWGPEDPEP